MEEQDFKVGDVVCDMRFGTGKVITISDKYDYTISVLFDGGYGTWYTKEGFIDAPDKYPSLRHGTWEQNFGNLPTIKPKRKVNRWVNLRRAFNNVVRDDTHLYYSAEDAKLAARNEVGLVAVAVEIEL